MAIYRRYPKAWPPEFSQFVRRLVTLTEEFRGLSDAEKLRCREEYNALFRENRYRLAGFLETWKPVRRATLRGAVKRKFSKRYYRNVTRRDDFIYTHEEASYALILMMYGSGNSTLPLKEEWERALLHDSHNGVKRVAV